MSMSMSMSKSMSMSMSMPGVDVCVHVHICDHASDLSVFLVTPLTLSVFVTRELFLSPGDSFTSFKEHKKNLQRDHHSKKTTVCHFN